MFRTVFILPVAGLLCGACATPPAPLPPPPAFQFEAAEGDPARTGVEANVGAGRETIEHFFGLPFAESVTVKLGANRQAFDASLPQDWGLAPTQCWMVGVGVADWVAILSPAAWPEDACEHDSADARHIQDIITHEMVHTFHGQRNPTRDFTGMDDTGWFVEGLAVYVSGQLDSSHLASAADAVAAGAAPKALESAWSGKYRYGVSGSLVAYIDDRFGRPKLVSLLDATTEAEILDRLSLTEEALLAGWEAWVISRS